MWRFVRFVLGLLLLPFLWAECLAVYSAVPDAFIPDFPYLSGNLISLAVGLFAWLALSCRFSVSNAIYVFGHEMTHAAWALATFSKVSKIKVSAGGGYCMISNPGMFTTLAPYFIPFYLVVVLLLRAILGIWLDMSPYSNLWMGAVGFTYGFHVTNTIATLVKVEQPDIHVYGRLFSCVFIAMANLGFLAIGMALATGMPLGELGGTLVDSAIGCYSATADVIMRLADKFIAHKW